MKLKNIIILILKLILSTLIILQTSIAIMRSTILNKEYIKNVLEKYPIIHKVLFKYFKT